MAKYWFQPKSYGYGFYPISWEGWLATLVLLIMILLSGWANGIFSEIGATAEGGVRFILDVFLIAAVATLFFEKKMKDPGKWRWGRNK